MGRTLVVTNDFPTRRGGIEAFVLSLCLQLPPEDVVVYTATMPGADSFDADLSFEVVRDRADTLLPSPRVGRTAAQILRSRGCDSVLFGAAAPLGLLAPSLRAAGAKRLVGLTHGHKVWWARVPVTRTVLRQIGDGCDTLTYVSDWCRDQIAAALSPQAAGRMRRLAPGVDTSRFAPGCGGAEVRALLGIDLDAPVLVCVARMVPRKGQDTLVRAWPQVLDSVPRARLLLVGDGIHRSVVERLVDGHGVRESVIFTGAVPWAEVPAHLDAGDVFAMPCRTRLRGLEPEALGIAILEAQACGLPVLVGDSGGAPETVRHGETGFVVDSHEPAAVAARLVQLLLQRDRADEMGKKGRAWVAEQWTWPRSGARARALLDCADPDSRP